MATAGPTTNRKRFGVFGKNSSFENSLSPSASGWSKPQTPARFGPTRSCKNAATLRSAQVEYIAMIIVIAKIIVMKMSFSMINALSKFRLYFFTVDSFIVIDFGHTDFFSIDVAAQKNVFLGRDLHFV